MLLLPPELRQDPFPYFARMRHGQPVTYDESDGTWSVFRHADVRTVMKDFTRFSSDPGQLIPPPPDLDRMPPSLIRLDPPDHRQMRSLVAPSFTPARMARLGPVIAAMAHDLIDAVADSGRMDVIEDLAFPLPVTVIAELLGVPAADRGLFRRWADMLLGNRRRFRFSEGTPAEALQAQSEMDDYFRAVIRARRTRPQDDLISEWVAHDGPDGFSEAEVLGLCALMLLAGHVTTVNLIGNAVWTLLEWPQALASMRHDPALIPLAVEEVLRFRGPVPSIVRFTNQAVTLCGQQIPAGTGVVAWLASANRDDTVFSDPDRFDVRRNPREHLAFGSGIHVCLGAPLARLEGQVVLRVLLERLDDWGWIDADVRQTAGKQLLYGLEQLPVSFRAHQAVAA